MSCHRVICGDILIYYSTFVQRVKTIHLEGLKIPHGPNLGEYVFVHVYSVHICEYILCVCCEAG